jgi:hypothetical protein
MNEQEFQEIVKKCEEHEANAKLWGARGIMMLAVVILTLVYQFYFLLSGRTDNSFLIVSSIGVLILLIITFYILPNWKKALSEWRKEIDKLKIET